MLNFSYLSHIANLNTQNPTFHLLFPKIRQKEKQLVLPTTTVYTYCNVTSPLLLFTLIVMSRFLSPCYIPLKLIETTCGIFVNLLFTTGMFTAGTFGMSRSLHI